jgi:hypothetical protein
LEQGFRIESREIVMEMNEFENPPLGLFLSDVDSRMGLLDLKSLRSRRLRGSSGHIA